MNIAKILLLTATCLMLSAADAPSCTLPQVSPLHASLATADFVAVMKVIRSEEKPSPLSELRVFEVLKKHAALEGRKEVRVKQSLQLDDPNNPPQLIVLGNVEKDEFKLFRAIPPNAHTIAYVRALLAIETTDEVSLARFCLPFLAHFDPDVERDAFRTLEAASSAAIDRASDKFSQETLRNLLRDGRRTVEQRQLYAYLLGACGNPADAALLRGELDRTLAKADSGHIDGFLKGLTLLSPKEGWDRTCRILEDPNASFLHRYFALRTVRHFVEARPKAIEKKEQLRAFNLVLSQIDTADFMIEDLRRWKRWELTKRVLSLTSQTNKLIGRMVLRYALQCPLPEAAEFVAQQRRMNPDDVAEMERRLEEEK